MDRNPIRSLFQKQIDKQDVSNVNLTKTVKAELLNFQESQMQLHTHSQSEVIDCVQNNEYIILDDDGFVSNDNYAQNHMHDLQCSEFVVLDDFEMSDEQRKNERTETQQTNYIILDENDLVVDVTNNGNTYTY